MGYVAKLEGNLIKTTVGNFELHSGIHQADEDSFDFNGEVFLSVEDLMNKRDRLLAFAALKSALENEDDYGSSVREISTDELAEFALKLCFDNGDV